MNEKRAKADINDAVGLVGLGCLFAGLWIQYSLGLALTVVGSAVFILALLRSRN